MLKPPPLFEVKTPPPPPPRDWWNVANDIANKLFDATDAEQIDAITSQHANDLQAMKAEAANLASTLDQLAEYRHLVTKDRRSSAGALRRRDEHA